MAKTGLKVSDPKVLIGLSVFFVLIGGMVIDPLAGFTCFVPAGILVFIAGLKGNKTAALCCLFIIDNHCRSCSIEISRSRPSPQSL